MCGLSMLLKYLFCFIKIYLWLFLFFWLRLIIVWVVVLEFVKKLSIIFVFFDEIE